MRHFFSNTIKAVLIISVLVAVLLAIFSSLTGKNVGQTALQAVLTPLRSSSPTTL